MRKNFSRILAGVLSAALVFSSGSYTAFAGAEGVSVNTDTLEAEVVTGPDIEPGEETGNGGLPTVDEPESADEGISELGGAYTEESQAEQPAAAGGENAVIEGGDKRAAEVSGSSVIEVLMIAGLPMKANQEFTVALEKTAQSVIQSRDITVPKSEDGDTAAPRAQASFKNLETGEYLVSISGIGYETYSQSLTVKEGLGYRIQVYTEKMPSNMDISKAHPGLIEWEGLEGVEDSSNLVNAIDKYEKKARETDEEGKPIAVTIEDADKSFDLNSDGKIDLLDLNYFTEHMSEFETIHSSVETFVPIDIENVKIAEESTAAKEEVTNLLTKNGETAKLTPKNPDAEISEGNPVVVALELEQNVAMNAIAVTTPQNSSIDEGTVTVEGTTLSGNTVAMELPIRNGVVQEEPNAQSEARAFSFEANAREGEDAAKKVLTIDLTGMVAVKKVTFKITKIKAAEMAEGTAKLNLAEISTVEFLNGMSERIPEPDMNIPRKLSCTAGDKAFRVSWTKEANVPCYEVRFRLLKVEVSEGIWQDRLGEYDCQRTTQNSLNITSYLKGKLTNNATYEVDVQSVNGEWKSGFCTPVQVTPKPSKVPDRPDSVKVTGGYKSITVSWLSLRNGRPDGFRVYYKSAEESTYNDNNVKLVGGGETSCKIEGLQDDTQYFAYVVAYNAKGDSPKSAEATDRTSSGLVGVEMPKYKLINTSNGEGVLTNHIVNAQVLGGSMQDSPLDAEGTDSALGLFDNNFTSYAQRNDWDWGGCYNGLNKGIRAELDGTYHIGMVTLAQPIDETSFGYVSIYYWKDNGWKLLENASIRQKKSGSRYYYLIKFDEIETSKIQIGIGRPNAYVRKITVAEVQLHEYDSLEHDILDLYADELHIQLKDWVNEETIADLQDRLDTPDPDSGEYHPDKETLQKELDIAKKLLKTNGLGDVISVNSSIAAAYDSGITGITGLNAWQPLGISASAGEELVIYVGKKNTADGVNAALQLVCTQYHSEYDTLSSTINLKIGRNEITVPQIGKTASERGGALYVQYTGKNTADDYRLRVCGGTKIPVLNVHGVPRDERMLKIQAYVDELKAYVETIKKNHDKLHEGGKANVNYPYKTGENCVLNSTDILMDQMLLSIPATQALAGMNSANSSDPAKALDNAIRSMEDMLILFYQHKGLTNSFGDITDTNIINKNHLPYRHLNIRYMRMFSGAFMYAGGNHIGIEWGSTPGVAGKGEAFAADGDGKHTAGSFFGWAISHEVGHEINQSAYEHTEITNNYFSVLAQAQDKNGTVRFDYDKVFRKVTSGAKGYADQTTQIGIYWQLHLAYDEGYNYKTYGNYQEIFNKLFFARVDSYARNPVIAPAPKGIALDVTSASVGDRDQKLMRLASAAAEKDLTEFFERWGMIPNDGTKAYMGQFPKETRAIYYGDDDARVARIEKTVDKNSISGNSVVSATVEEPKKDEVDVKLEISLNPGADSNSLQGYEITRIYTAEGKERKEVAGFTRPDGGGTTTSFTDHVPFAANRVLKYEVTAIDKCMNRSEAYRVTPAVKIYGGGLQDSSSWSVVTNMTSEDDKTVSGNAGDDGEGMPCESKVLASERITDKDTDTTYTGKADKADPYIILELNQPTEVEALRYILKDDSKGAAITNYRIEISDDGETYTTVKTGTFELGADGCSKKEYLENENESYIHTYETSFVKLTAVGMKGKEISVSELELYGPSGDNVELKDDGIGILDNDYVYDPAKGKNGTIPKGSIVFTGTYKGHPAYNVVVLYDENGNIVTGENQKGELIADQIILARELKKPEALLGNTSNGKWVYWIDPTAMINQPKTVRAELYRVDDAMKNEGQRLVSDTKVVDCPTELLPISIETGTDTSKTE